ncbi:MAG: redox-sensing transcriptional repressor Rex [Armatimonadetes bacterium]|nr:redox-sensing transcriptional repressor Rex [Armatimonadota bacterium]
MADDSRVPIPTLTRLATYYKILGEAQVRGVHNLNSAQIEAECGISAAQFRKDLSHFGEMGKPGVGYEVAKLRARIATILHLDRTQRFALIGAGRLGQALAAYPGLNDYSFELTALFDTDKKKIGRRVNGIEIEDADGIPNRMRELNLKIAVLTVPGSEAQKASDAAIKGGARWILNFTPAHVRVPENCMVRDIVFTQEFAVLAHYIEE